MTRKTRTKTERQDKGRGRAAGAELGFGAALGGCEVYEFQGEALGLAGGGGFGPGYGAGVGAVFSGTVFVGDGDADGVALFELLGPLGFEVVVAAA